MYGLSLGWTVHICEFAISCVHLRLNKYLSQSGSGFPKQNLPSKKHKRSTHDPVPVLVPRRRRQHPPPVGTRYPSCGLVDPRYGAMALSLSLSFSQYLNPSYEDGACEASLEKTSRLSGPQHLWRCIRGRVEEREVWRRRSVLLKGTREEDSEHGDQLHEQR